MAKKNSRNGSSRLMRRIRALIILALLVGAPFYGKPAIDWVMVHIQTETGAWEGVTYGAGKSPYGQWAVGDGTLCYLDGSKVRAVNGSGKPLWSRDVLAGADGLRFSDGTLLVSSRAGLGVQRLTTEGKLLSAVKAPGQFMSVLESDKGLVFINPDVGQYYWTGLTGSGRGAFQVAEGRILLSRVNPTTGSIAVAALRGGQNAVETIVLRYDSEGRLLGARTFQDAVLVDAGFLDNTFVVVLDSGVLGLDDQMKDVWSIREPSRYYQTAFGSDALWVHRIPEGQTAALLQCINGNGKIISSRAEESESELMAAGPQNKLALASGQTVRICDGKGKRIAEFDAREALTGIAWVDGGSLLLQYKNRIELHPSKSGSQR